MSRVATQTLEGLQIDRKAMDLALQRALGNETRPSAENKRMIALLTELIQYYTTEMMRNMKTPKLKRAQNGV